MDRVLFHPIRALRALGTMARAAIERACFHPVHRSVALKVEGRVHFLELDRESSGKIEGDHVDALTCCPVDVENVLLVIDV